MAVGSRFLQDVQYTETSLLQQFYKRVRQCYTILRQRRNPGQTPLLLTPLYLPPMIIISWPNTPSAWSSFLFWPFLQSGSSFVGESIQPPFPHSTLLKLRKCDSPFDDLRILTLFVPPPPPTPHTPGVPHGAHRHTVTAGGGALAHAGPWHLALWGCPHAIGRQLLVLRGHFLRLKVHMSSLPHLGYPCCSHDISVILLCHPLKLTCTPGLERSCCLIVEMAKKNGEPC